MPLFTYPSLSPSFSLSLPLPPSPCLSLSLPPPSTLRPHFQGNITAALAHARQQLAMRHSPEVLHDMATMEARGPGYPLVVDQFQ